MVFEEKTISTERIYEGAILNLRKDKVTVMEGESFREIVEHRGGAVIAAVKDDGSMVMVKQFRKPAERVMLEVPAGKIDAMKPIRKKLPCGNFVKRPAIGLLTSDC